MVDRLAAKVQEENFRIPEALVVLEAAAARAAREVEPQGQTETGVKVRIVAKIHRNLVFTMVVGLDQVEAVVAL
jgi:hypothetical protein